MDKKQPKVFYGWWIVGAGFGIAFLESGVVFYGFTAVFEPLADEFGWSYAQISLAMSLRGLESSLLAPLVGILVDRWGTRRLLFGAVVLIGFGLTLLSRTNSLFMFYLAFAIVALGVSGSSSTVITTAVANWFQRRVSMATGILISGFGFGGLLIPVVTRLIDMLGWRPALVFVGVGIWIIGLPLSLLIRHKPEQYGYLPDGEIRSPVALGKESVSTQVAPEDVGVRQALKSGTFWRIALALMFQSMILNGMVTHVMPYLSSISIARSISSLVASGIPLLSVVGRLGFGWLGDKFNKRRITAGGFAMMSVGLLCFSTIAAGGIWLSVPFLILFGIGYGGNNTMRAAMLREIFGRSRFGTIHGFVLSVTMVGVIIGAPLVGWVFDTWGSYEGIWLVFAGLAVVALIIVSTIPSANNAIQTTYKPVP